MTSVPCGTCNSRSLTFSLMSFWSGMNSYCAPLLSLSCTHKRSGRFVGAAPPQMVFEFAAPFFHNADGWHRSCVAQRTEGAAKHVFREVGDEVDVFHAAEPG